MNPIVCTERDRVDRCARLMREHDIGFLPVVDLYHRVVGVLTDRDIATRVVADRLSPHTLVSDAMTHGPVVFCRPDDDLHVAESRMSRARKSRIVVVDDDGHCKGVISLSDISQAVGPLEGGRVLHEVTRREAYPPTPP